MREEFDLHLLMKKSKLRAREGKRGDLS